MNRAEILDFFGGEKKIHSSLDRIKAALHAYDAPQNTGKSIIVAGTNGKGSTTLFLSAALVEAGFKVGSFLSPHLEFEEERILMQLQKISSFDLDQLFREFFEAAKKFDLSYFEFFSFLYFQYAKRQAVDFNVLEVGMGGRWDATNVIDPIASVITSIGFDHQKYLGNSLKEILAEKLAVVPQEGLLFTAVENPSLLSQIEKYCEEKDAIYYYSKEIQKEVLSRNWGGQQVCLNGQDFTLSNPSQGFLQNAATAYLLLQIVFPKIPVSVIQKGFQKVKNPGRLEVMQESPRVVLSGDHNVEGCLDLIEFLQSQPKQGKTFVLCGFSLDKPYQKMVELLSLVAEEMVITSYFDKQEEIPESYKELGEFVANPHQALDRVLGRAEKGDQIIVTGSLYLVGRLRGRWRQHFEEK